MAQNVTIAGASYPDVPSIIVPKTGGGSAAFMDTSDADATAADILSGKTAYVGGLKIIGTGSGGLSNTDALLHVNAPLGSTVTFAKGGVTVKTITSDKAFPNVDGTTADYYYSVTSANYGTWTVTATLSGDTASNTVSVSAAKQYDVELAYNIAFVRNGVLTSLPWTIATNPSYPGAAVTQESGDVLFTTGHVNAATVFGSTDAYDLTDYATLRIVVSSGQSYYNSNHAPCVAIGRNRPTGTGTSGSATNLDYKTMLNNSTGNITATTYTINVSTLTGLFYVGISLAGSSTMSPEGGNGFVRVTDFGIYK